MEIVETVKKNPLLKMETIKKFNVQKLWDTKKELQEN